MFRSFRISDLTRADDGLTALHLAVASKNPDKVKILLEAGCSVGALDRELQTPLDSYIKNNVDNMQILRMLLDNGADPTRVHIKGHPPPLCSPLASAAEINLMAHAAAARGFFDWGVQRYAVSEGGRTILPRRAKSKAKQRLRRYR